MIFAATFLLVSILSTHAQEGESTMIFPAPKIETGTMGGVPNPGGDVLLAMHEAQYVLHARDGKLTKLPVEKSRLPADPRQRHQGIMVARADDGTVYVRQPDIMCKSTDGGRAWTSHPDPDDPAWFQILADGTFVSVQAAGAGPVRVRQSRDEGRTWETIAEFPVAFEDYDDSRSATFPLFRLPDDTLLWSIQLRKEYVFEGPSWNSVSTSGGRVLVMYRSTDRGQTWRGPIRVHEFVSEGGMTVLPGGRLLATLRHQRPLLPGDPSDLLERLAPAESGFPYKHIILAESDDAGRSWSEVRQLTTEFGQCYGFPVALPDGTVVVVHATPYGPGHRGSRAMISYDEGRTWADQAYYLTISEPSGYNQSVVLEDGTILTVAARNDDEPLTAIRWKPVPRR